VPPPPIAEKPRATGTAGVVTVAKGDTVYAVSRRHHVFVRAVIEANGLKPPYGLAVGQRLVLPKAREHLVQRGETLYSLARVYDVSVYALARANRLKAPYSILVGQRLRVPRSAGKVARAPASVARPKPKAPAAASGKGPAASSKWPIPPRKPPVRAAIPKPPPKSGKGFRWPVVGKVVSNYGTKAKGLRNDGINIIAPRGAPVRAAENGVVAYAGNELRGFGNLLLIKHAGGWVTAYAHNEKLMVRRGQRVRKGDVIGKVGSSGSVGRPQLHFEMRKGRRAINPRKYLPDRQA
jgi:murein DD-endopeptidase MepM/ murein hydrolase activator NlpD